MNAAAEQHEDIKARISEIEQSLVMVAEILHKLHHGDVTLGGVETTLLQKVKAMVSKPVSHEQ